MNAVLKESHTESVGPALTGVYGINGYAVSDFIDPQNVLDPDKVYGTVTTKNSNGININTLLSLKSASSIGIYFSTSNEGRPYSLAIRLREQGYIGELHAMGSVNQEMVYHLVRVGFTHFHLPKTIGPRIEPTVLAPFGGHYQQTFIETSETLRR